MTIVIEQFMKLREYGTRAESKAKGRGMSRKVKMSGDKLEFAEEDPSPLVVDEVFIVVSDPDIKYLSVILQVLQPKVITVRDIKEDFFDKHTNLYPIKEAVDVANQSYFEVAMATGQRLDHLVLEDFMANDIIEAIQYNESIFELAGRTRYMITLEPNLTQEYHTSDIIIGRTGNVRGFLANHIKPSTREVIVVNDEIVITDELEQMKSEFGDIISKKVYSRIDYGELFLTRPNASEFLKDKKIPILATGLITNDDDQPIMFYSLKNASITEGEE